MTLFKYTVEQFKKDLAEPYVWPGGYPRYFVCTRGEALSYEAAREAEMVICVAIDENGPEEWRIIACDVNWEDNELYCDHTGKKIESAYNGDAL